MQRALAPRTALLADLLGMLGIDSGEKMEKDGIVH
jgi:hypothetical protein